MINKQQAMDAKHGDVFYHRTLRNSDRSPLRARVSGKCKTLKRQPEIFKLPIKHGLRDHGYITNDNAMDWCITETAAYVERD